MTTFSEVEQRIKSGIQRPSYRHWLTEKVQIDDLNGGCCSFTGTLRRKVRGWRSYMGICMGNPVVRLRCCLHMLAVHGYGHGHSVKSWLACS